MTDQATPDTPSLPADLDQRDADYRRHFSTAAGALVAAIRTEATDGAEIISHLLATAAANLGGMDMLTAGRPGSWEANYVDQFLGSTVGPDGDYLLEYRTAPIEVVESVDNTMDELDISYLYDDSAVLIEIAEADPADGDIAAASSRVEQAEELIEQLRQRDYAAYREAFERSVREAARGLVEAKHLPADLPVSVRWVDWTDRDLATGEQGAWGTVEHELWQTARDKTPLPGFTEPLEAIRGIAGVLLEASGRMPHQRIPALAHYMATSDSSSAGGGQA